MLGGLFIIKLLYLIATVCALPVTQGALFVQTSSFRINHLLDAVPMGAHDLLVDLGCGSGRVLRAARKRYNVNTLGFEVNLLAYVIARFSTIGVKGARIRWGNFWEKDLSEADVVFCYLFPDVMLRLKEKLERELHPGACVISCNFPIPGWTPMNVVTPDSSRHGDPIYIY
jgi:trans-aconitate methyltransferase